MNGRIFLVALGLISLLGCTSTVRNDNALTQRLSSAESATITVRRSGSWVGGAVPAGIQDGTTKIGVLGPSGELTWSRDPGYAAIVTSNGADHPMHVLIFPVEAGKKYSLIAKLVGGWGFYSEPENFDPEFIVFEKKAETQQGGILDDWKLELKRLSLRYDKQRER